jgi:ribonuclease-3
MREITLLKLTADFLQQKCFCNLFRFGYDKEMESAITHNERLEFLGDAVVEFVSSIHLFHLFPDLEEGGLATYRAAIVQNQHLAVLAQVTAL